MGLATARDAVHERPLAPAMTVTDSGLALGATVLAPMRDADGAPEIAVDGAEERILALLAIGYGGKIGARVLDHIRRASQYWRKGEKTLAAIELALTGLPPLPDGEQAWVRLSLAVRLLANGVTPRELIKDCDLDPTLLDLVKGYNPDQPRVPAGSPDGGQWTSDQTADERGETGSTISPLGGAPSGAGSSGPYKVIKEPPKDAKVVVPPDGVPIRAGDPPRVLIAPANADYRQIRAAGQAIAQLPPWKQNDYVRTAIGQEGTYDFQRDVANRKFYQAYTPAANYAVGVYMAGAGYTLDITLALAKLYALRNSSNYDTQDQLGWIKRGWRDAKSGRWQ
jgi:hypothetical protein